MPVFQIFDDHYNFPPPELAHDSGLLALGGTLCVKRLLNAYSNGIFPWYNPGEIVQWWCPKERFVIFPEKLHVSRSMKKVMKRTSLKVKMNTDFDCVIKNCRMMRESGTWITDEMEEAYNNLFIAGYAMCAGVYEKEALVGGLYGVVIGKCFFGESMFSKTANASKLALIRLCEKLAEEDFVFVDCQFHTEHLEKMGGQYISLADYRLLLEKGLG